MTFGLVVLLAARVVCAQQADPSEPVAVPASERASETAAKPENEPPTAEAKAPESPRDAGFFIDPEDGDFDISKFLSTRAGFLPLAVPITEPAVGYGLAIGLTFFHSKPQVVKAPDGKPRVIMPSMTAVFGAGTENGTRAAGVGHVGIWDKGRIRYTGSIGYADMHLDWYGRGESLAGSRVSYTNDVFFLNQQIIFQLGDSNFFLGPAYRFQDSDANFSGNTPVPGIPPLEYNSQIGGLGATLTYDSLDQPFSPTSGVNAQLTYSQQDEVFGSDFDYGRTNGTYITYYSLSDTLILGLRGDAGFITGGHAPFYDLQGLNMRGITRGQYVDNTALQAQAQLRWDFTKRWSLVGFGGLGRVADDLSDIGSADTHGALGTGFRYLIAREYGLRIGLDAAVSDEGEAAFYVSVGTGWTR